MSSQTFVGNGPVRVGLPTFGPGVIFYDVHVSCHTCGSSLNSRTNVFSGIPQGIFAALGCPVHEWNGKTGMEVLPMLQAAVTRLAERDEVDQLHRKYSNTITGTAGNQNINQGEFAKEWLTDMRDACAREPLAVIRVS